MLPSFWCISSPISASPIISKPAGNANATSSSSSPKTSASLQSRSLSSASAATRRAGGASSRDFGRILSVQPPNFPAGGVGGTRGLAHEPMVDAWWPLLGAAIPALVAGQAIRIKRRRDEEQRLKAARGREKSSDEVFVCERVCTSKRMLKKVGAFSKDPIPETCVTVCGVSELDACADACARTVCVNQHQVPNWNDVCLKRCQSECLKLSSTLM